MNDFAKKYLGHSNLIFFSRAQGASWDVTLFNVWSFTKGRSVIDGIPIANDGYSFDLGFGPHPSAVHNGQTALRCG